jgi:hypothetical protein
MLGAQPGPTQPLIASLLSMGALNVATDTPPAQRVRTWVANGRESRYFFTPKGR